jgi:carboxylate/amino acid/amine transporter
MRSRVFWPASRFDFLGERFMGYLLIVTLIQAFSFSLIGEYLAGHVDSYFAVLVRVVLAGLVFIPLTRWRQVEPGFMRGMLLIGALQFGITYVCLYLSFRVLTVPEVLLFTILTPLHVTLIEDALNRRFNPWALVAALVAVAGAAVIRFDSISPDFFGGFLLLQLGNFTYAAGQVLYKRLVARYPSDVPHYQRFGFFYLGALAVVLPAFLLFGKANFLPEAPLQWGVLVFLGLISTALGLYWWNKGACMVRVGTLAVMNILHVPVGLLISLLIWNQHEPLGRLFIGGLVIAFAVWISRLDRRAVTV